MNKTVAVCFLLCLCLSLCGCVHAPAFNILGSYFPAWMLCAFGGVLITVLVRLVIDKLALRDYVRPAVLTYPSMVALFTFSFWLLLFS